MTTTPNATPTTNAAAFAAAQAVIPGGVDSPVRAFGSVGGTPRFMAGARGPYLTDVEGNEYVDLVCSWGPMLLGHQHPEVVEAVHAAVDRGLGFGTSTLEETALAELIASKVPVERVRFVSTGTEATMTALRLARGVTGRNLIVKFAGCYHGHSDGLLAAAGLSLFIGILGAVAQTDLKRVLSFTLVSHMGYMLFGIVQGGDIPDLRHASARGLTDIGFHGYAIGGLAVGEPQAVMLSMIEETAPALPADRPRYQLLIMLDEPRPTPQTHGYATSGWNAVPTAGKVIARIAPLLGVEPRFDLPSAEQMILANSNKS